MYLLCLKFGHFCHLWQFSHFSKMYDWKLLFCDWSALFHPLLTLPTITLKQFIPDHKRCNGNRSGNKKETLRSLRLQLPRLRRCFWQCLRLRFSIHTFDLTLLTISIVRLITTLWTRLRSAVGRQIFQFTHPSLHRQLRRCWCFLAQSLVTLWKANQERFQIWSFLPPMKIFSFLQDRGLETTVLWLVHPFSPSSDSTYDYVETVHTRSQAS